MNRYVLGVGAVLVLLQCLSPPSGGPSAAANWLLAGRLVEIGLVTVLLAYATRPPDSADLLQALRRPLSWTTEKYLLVGSGTLCLGFTPVVLAPWLAGGGTALSLSLLFTLPAAGALGLLYLLYRLVVDRTATPLLIAAPWLVVFVPSLLYLAALAWPGLLLGGSLLAVLVSVGVYAVWH